MNILSTWLDWDPPEHAEDPGSDEDEAYDDWRQGQADLDEWPERSWDLKRHCQDLARLGATPEDIMASLTPDELARLPF